MVLSGDCSGGVLAIEDSDIHQQLGATPPGKYRMRVALQ